MEANVRAELDAMKGMVLAWKKSYLRDAPPEGGGEYLAEEFLQEIETYVNPYVRRLFETNYLSEAEAKEFLDLCYDEVNDLLSSLEKIDNPWLRIAGLE